MENLMTVSQVAAELNITTQHARLLIREKKMRAEKVGSQWLVQRESFERFKASYRKFKR